MTLQRGRLSQAPESSVGPRLDVCLDEGLVIATVSYHESLSSVPWLSAEFFPGVSEQSQQELRVVLDLGGEPVQDCRHRRRGDPLLEAFPVVSMEGFLALGEYLKERGFTVAWQRSVRRG